MKQGNYFENVFFINTYIFTALLANRVYYKMNRCKELSNAKQC